MDASASEIFAAFESQKLFSDRRGPDNRATRIAPIEDCRPGDLVFVSKPKLAEIVRVGKPAIAVASAEAARALEGIADLSVLIVENVNLAQAWIKQRYADRDLFDTEFGRIHESAVIHDTASVASDAVVGPRVVIGAQVAIGSRAVIMAGSVIERDAQIGEGTVVHPNVTVGYGCIIGCNCILKSGAVIGSEGFGFAQDDARHHHRIPQTGIVVIEDRVVIGANNCIDRAAYQTTRIKSGAIFDNLCHVAHNAEIGEDSILVAMTGVAGSTTIGKRCVLSGQCGIVDHLKIADDVILLHRPAVFSDIPRSGVYAGNPLTPIQDYMRNHPTLKRSYEMLKRIKDLEAKLEKLEKGTSASS
ncbi:MAG: UDP-3-O-(3-hydroxymyristoyl)glucosamine N-acyltransferase [Leptospirales bacterium]|nr:UDP-3-O-(3-hydroxymyristoyl)glucosamine N-acyltransferase [Leptospirales bacterium]